MRVLMLAFGHSVHTIRWLRGLQAKGIDLHLLARTDPAVPGVTFHADVVSPWRPWRPRRWVIRRRNMLRDLYARIQPDIVHVHMPSPHSVFPEDLGGIPLVVTSWGTEILTKDTQDKTDIQRRANIIASANVVLAASRYLADATAKYACLPAGRVLHQPWGVDLREYQPSVSRHRELAIGFPKHLNRVYGPDVVLKAFSLVRGRNIPVRLYMMGDGEMEHSLRRMADDLSISDHVSWCGHVPHEEMPRRLAQFTISVMPSRRESYGLAALESQAMEVPVVATGIGGIPEIVVDGKTGILVPPDNPEQLAIGIRRLLGDEQLRFKMGQAGRKNVEENFDWDTTLDEMATVYERTVAARATALGRNLMNVVPLQ